jgi:hypothetical protein
MRPAQLLSLKSLSLMLLLCFALTAEETIHLVRSHPNEIDWSRTISHHPGCTPLDATGRIVRCPVRGYGNMNFLCSEERCVAKQPYSGLSVTAAENQLLDRQRF